MTPTSRERATRAFATPRPSATALRAHFAGDPTQLPKGDTLRAVLCDTLDRADEITDAHQAMWQKFLSLLEQNRDAPRAGARCAVLANLVALVAFDEPGDYAATADLSVHLGAARLARLQQRASQALESSTDLPWTTTAVRRLLARDLHARLLEDPRTSAVADRIAAACSHAAQCLLFEDLDLDHTTAPLGSVRDFLELTERGSIVAWRRHLGMIAASPWGPYADDVLLFAQHAETPHARAAVESSIEFCREWCRDRERDQVAREIRQLVALSGVSQREFASRIGTSPSRLSTYVRGTVTPSAAMLLRIQRASRMLQRQPVRAVGGPRR